MRNAIHVHEGSLSTQEIQRGRPYGTSILRTHYGTLSAHAEQGVHTLHPCCTTLYQRPLAQLYVLTGHTALWSTSAT